VAGQPLLHIGAHSVGVKDGGPGIPVLYLSTQGGDIRLPHLLGIHAVQTLLSWLITSALAHLRERTQALMWTAGLRMLFDVPVHLASIAGPADNFARCTYPGCPCWVNRSDSNCNSNNLSERSLSIAQNTKF